MVPDVRLQDIILGKNPDEAFASCIQHKYDESWIIMDGALIVYDPADPPEWMKEAIATRDEDGNTPQFYRSHPPEQDRIPSCDPSLSQLSW